MTGSAVGPYRLVKTSRPSPRSASSAMHSGSSKRSRTRRACTPRSGEAAPREELRSASSSGIGPTLAVCPVTARGRRGLSRAPPAAIMRATIAPGGIFRCRVQTEGGARRLSVGNWQLDPYHTQVEFSAKHLAMMTVRGYFDELSTVADIDPDHPETSSVEATIATASLRTNNGIRDNDIKSSNFLEVDKYPFIKFKSTSVEPSGPDHYKLTGDLTIKETTRPVALDVVKYGEFNDPSMGHRISYGATTKINRKNFGLSFNAILDGRMVVSEEIQITIEGELVEQKQTEQAATS